MRFAAADALSSRSCRACRSSSRETRRSDVQRSSDPRVGLKAGFPRCGNRRAQHGAGRKPSEARGILRPESAGRFPDTTGADPRGRRGRPAHSSANTNERHSSAAAARSQQPELRELRSRVPQKPRLRRQLPRVQHLRHRERRKAAAARVGRVPGRPGRRVGSRQPAVHVGRADARPDRLRHGRALQTPVSAERFRGVRIFDISDIRKPKQIAAVQTCRGSHTHTLVADPDDKRNVYIYGSGTGRGAVGRGAGGLLGAGSGRRSEHGAVQHRRHPGAARGAGEGAHRQPPAHLRRPGDRRDRRALERRRSRPGHAARARDQSVPRHHGLSGDWAGRRRVLGQRHPARYLRSGQSGAARSGRGQEFRLLALGDVQQRRHEGDLHRRMGRRHAPRCRATRSADLGRRTRSSTSSIGSCASPATTSCRRRRPSRKTASRTTAR